MLKELDDRDANIQGMSGFAKVERNGKSGRCPLSPPVITILYWRNDVTQRQMRLLMVSKVHNEV